MNTMAEFFGSLGALATPVLGLRGNLGSTMVGRPLDATAAMHEVLKRYSDLSVYGEQLRQVLVAGGTVPCNVWNAYNTACIDYMTKSQLLFDQLVQKGVTVEQVIYSGGKPVPDPALPGAYRTLKVSAPLRPPAFGFAAASCPGIVNFQGSPVGWTPIPIDEGVQLGSIASATLNALGAGSMFILAVGSTPLGAAAYSSYRTLKAISVWMTDYDQPSSILAAFTSCFEKLVKGGLTPAAASTQCSSAQASAQQYAVTQASTAAAGAAWGFWSWVGVGAAVLITGGVLALYFRGRVAALTDWSELGDLGEPGGLDCACSFGGSNRARGRAYRHRRPPMLLGDLYLHPRG